MTDITEVQIGKTPKRVRCKECKYWHRNNSRIGECRCKSPSYESNWGQTRSEDWCGEGINEKAPNVD